MNVPFTYGSLFTGIGGWDLALDRAGFQCAWQVEIDPVCRSVLARHWPEVARYEDVCQVGAHNLPPVDVLVFSAPCQDLSVAGKRAGLDGARSGLYFEAIRICRELRPAIALFEQVTGLLSSDGGRDFGRALDALADIGALDIGWAVLDARWWRVAQRRRRLYVSADFTDRRASQILALSDGLSGHPAPRREAGASTTTALTSRTGGGGGPDDSNAQGNQLAYQATGDAYCREGANPLAASDDNGSNHLVASAITAITAITASAGHHGHSSPRGDGSDNLVLAFTSKDSGGDVGTTSPTLRAMNYDQSHLNGGGQVAIVESRYARNGRGAPEAVCPPLKAQSGQTGKGDSAPLVMAFRERTRAEGARLEHQADLAYALTNPGDGGRSDERSLVTGMTVRRLTPVECERLMSLPDSWTEYGADGPIADSHRYRMLGNSVVANVAQWIGHRLIEALS